MILALSNGVNNYAKQLEKDALSDYPLTVERKSFDLLGSISVAFKDNKIKKENCEKGKICSEDDVIKSYNMSAGKGMIKRNNLVEFGKYIDTDEFKKLTSEIIYKYDMDLPVYTKDYQKVNPTDLATGDNNIIFKELSTREGIYEVLSGSLPKNYNEVVLVVGENRKIKDSLLYSLGIKDKAQLEQDIQRAKTDESYLVADQSYSYDDILNRTYKVILNTDKYKEENGLYVDYSNNADYMKNKIDNGEEIKIVGIVQEKDAGSCYVGYSHDLTLNQINKISKTSIYQKQINNKDVNVITGEQFDEISSSYDNLAKELGIYEIDNPSSINIYPKDYKSKVAISELIESYNKNNKEAGREDLVVNYSDLMKDLVGGISTAINIVSFVLIGFVAISLIVSSIMIAIITYISVLERTKEIGILRAIGASKKDIKRVFKAETIIEGLVAGLLGIGIAFIITVMINTIVSALAHINNIATIPFGSAVILILLSVGLNVLAGSKPSSMAAKKDPVEALRTE